MDNQAYTVRDAHAGSPILSAMSFNIRGALFDDGANRWPNRADLNARTILRYAPDLIGFQECHQGNLDIYRVRLAGYEWVTGPAYNNDAPHFQYPAIFWKPDRLKLIESDGFWLSLTPDRHSGSWGTDCVRSATWALFEQPRTLQRFVHLNTHLDHVSELARVEGARLIVQRLHHFADEGVPLLVTGDFNCMPGTPAYRQFVAGGFADAYLTAGHTTPVSTFHGFQGHSYHPKPHETDRIDWILMRDGRQRWQVNDCRLITDSEPPLYPSDHWPVLASLSFIADSPSNPPHDHHGLQPEGSSSPVDPPEGL